jgi:hypothetical protein
VSPAVAGNREGREAGEHRRPEARWPLRAGRWGTANEQRKGPAPGLDGGQFGPYTQIRSLQVGPSARQT